MHKHMHICMHAHMRVCTHAHTHCCRKCKCRLIPVDLGIHQNSETNLLTLDESKLYNKVTDRPNI